MRLWRTRNKRFEKSFGKINVSSLKTYTAVNSTWYSVPLYVPLVLLSNKVLRAMITIMMERKKNLLCRIYYDDVVTTNILTETSLIIL